MQSSSLTASVSGQCSSAEPVCRAPSLNGGNNECEELVRTSDMVHLCLCMICIVFKPTSKCSAARSPEIHLPTVRSRPGLPPFTRSLYKRTKQPLSNV